MVIINSLKITFGVNFYDVVKEYSRRRLQMDEGDFDFRPYSLLCAHKKMMTLRAKFLMDKGYVRKNAEKIVWKFAEVEKKAHSLIHMSLYYNMTNKTNTIYKILQQIDDIESTERVALEHLILLLENR